MKFLSPLFLSVLTLSAGLFAQTSITNVLGQHNVFAPHTGEAEILKRDFEVDTIKRVQEGIVAIRAELASVYKTLSYQKLFINRKKRLQGANFYRVPLDRKEDYYFFAKKRIRNNFYIDRSIILLEQIQKRYISYASLFSVVIKEEELSNTLHSLYGMLGIVYLYKGSRRSLAAAVDSFEFILGKNPDKKDYTESEEERNQIYSYLIGAYNELIKTSLVGEREHLILTRKKLYYLWNNALLENKNNTILRDAKLRYLADRYFPVMDYYGENFRKFYRDYTDQKVPSNNTGDAAKSPLSPQGDAELQAPGEVMGENNDNNRESGDAIKAGGGSEGSEGKTIPTENK